MAVMHQLETLFDWSNAKTWPLLALVALVAAYYASRKLRRIQAQRRFARDYGCKPVAVHLPTWDPFFGIDDIFTKTRLAKDSKFLEAGLANFDRLGPTYQHKIIENTIIVTREPENVKTILSLKFKEFGIGSRVDTFGRLLGRGIFTIDGDAWHNSRQLIRPNFTRDQVADLDAFERHIQTLFKLLPRDGSTVDLQDYFFKFTIDSATEFLFGKSTNTLKAQLTGATASAGSAAAFADAFNFAQHYVARLARMGALANLYYPKDGGAAIRTCHDFVDQFVEEAVQHRERMDELEKSGQAKDDEKYMFLRELARSTKDKIRLRDELLNVLLAGRDTTASLLSNMWFCLARRPEILQKLRDEVQQTLEGRRPTYQELRNMKYLRHCMNESLRLHPVVPGNGRIALTDTFIPLGGGPDGKSPVFLAKGDLVFYSTYSMHRRKDYYGEDAEEYRPERWETLRPGWEFLPFNGGPRICLGQQYALSEAGYVTVRLLQEFAKVESRDPEPWIESLTLTVCSKNGTLVSLTPA